MVFKTQDQEFCVANTVHLYTHDPNIYLLHLE